MPKVLAMEESALWPRVQISDLDPAPLLRKPPPEQRPYHSLSESSVTRIKPDFARSIGSKSCCEDFGLLPVETDKNTAEPDDMENSVQQNTYLSGSLSSDGTDFQDIQGAASILVGLQKTAQSPEVPLPSRSKPSIPSPEPLPGSKSKSGNADSGRSSLAALTALPMGDTMTLSSQQNVFGGVLCCKLPIPDNESIRAGSQDMPALYPWGSFRDVIEEARGNCRQVSSADKPEPAASAKAQLVTADLGLGQQSPSFWHFFSKGFEVPRMPDNVIDEQQSLKEQGCTYRSTPGDTMVHPLYLESGANSVQYADNNVRLEAVQNQLMENSLKDADLNIQLQAVLNRLTESNLRIQNVIVESDRAKSSMKHTLKLCSAASTATVSQKRSRAGNGGVELADGCGIFGDSTHEAPEAEDVAWSVVTQQDEGSDDSDRHRSKRSRLA